MSPLQHGEVFVTSDGTETDLDLGYYERFIRTPMTRRNNFTTGRVYADVIAKGLVKTTIANFREADILAGGQGAPLVPYVDHVLFHSTKAPIAVHNLGGISNVTIVTTSSDDVMAFDTGPANCLIDIAMRKLFGKHLVDERRHMSGFQALFDKLQVEAGADPLPPPVARPMNQKFSVIGLMAYLEIQELRGEQMIRVYRQLFEGDGAFHYLV